MTSSTISLIPKSPAEVAKAILYIAITAVSILQASLSGGVTPVEIIQIVLAIVTLIPVYLLAGTKVKMLVAFVSAALQALAIPLAASVGWGPISLNDLISVLLAAFAAIGIATVPNKPMIDARETGTVTTLGS